jgi:hypothetical protein
MVEHGSVTVVGAQGEVAKRAYELELVDDAVGIVPSAVADEEGVCARFS